MKLKNLHTVFIVSVVLGAIYLFYTVMKNSNFAKNMRSRNYKYFDYDEFDTPAVVGVDESSKIYSKNGRSYLKNSGLENMDATFLNMLDKARDIVEKEYNSTNQND